MTATDAWLDGEPDPVPYTFGPWSFELRGAALSDIAYKGVPLLRSVRVVVRDRDWQTIEPELLGIESDASQLRLHARSRDGGIDFGWSAVCAFTDDGIDVAVHGTAHTDFLRNRIGIIVLHRPDTAGMPLTIVHPGGDTEAITLPVSISPHQPARDIAGLRWDTAPGSDTGGLQAGKVHVELDFTGDVFEMEDQRNWTDASFKTYSTPLSIPFPVQLHAGDTIDQRLVIRASGGDSISTSGVSDSSASGDGAQPAAVTLHSGTRAMPAIWAGASTAPDPDRGAAAGIDASAASADTAAFGGILVELDTTTPMWRAALARAASDAGPRPLDVRIVVRAAEAEAAIPAVLDELVALGAGRIARLGVYDSASHLAEDTLWAALAAAASGRLPAAELVGGTRAHFTELNRHHERLASNGGALAFSITPQMHDLGRDQVIESIPMQRLVALQAVRFAAGRPVHVGPVTLRSRFNAVATSAPAAGSSATLAGGYGAQLVRAATDPRQRGRGFAAWILASAAALAVPGIASITYGEAWGPRGLVSADGTERFPAHTAIGWLADIAGWDVADVRGDLPEGASLIAATRGDSIRLILANPAGRPCTVAVDLAGLGGAGAVRASTVVELVADAAGAVRWSSDGDAGPVLETL